MRKIDLIFNKFFLVFILTIFFIVGFFIFDMSLARNLYNLISILPLILAIYVFRTSNFYYRSLEEKIKVLGILILLNIAFPVGIFILDTFILKDSCGLMLLLPAVGLAYLLAGLSMLTIIIILIIKIYRNKKSRP